MHAASITALFGFLTWLFPPASYLSGAAIGLSVLRQGPVEGGRVMALATAVVGLIALLSFGSVLPVSALIVVWVLAWFGALVLRATASQGILLMVFGLFAAAVVGWLYATSGTNEENWFSALQDFYAVIAGSDGTAAVKSQLEWFASLMNGIFVAGMLVSLVATVYIARWWQASLYNPGGFGSEFRQLRIPEIFLAVAAAVVVLGYLYMPVGETRGVGAHLFIVMAVVYMFQGLAVIHFKVGAWQLGVAWLVVLYIFLVIRSYYAVPLLGLLGVADSILDFRGLRHKHLDVE